MIVIDEGDFAIKDSKFCHILTENAANVRLLYANLTQEVITSPQLIALPKPECERALQECPSDFVLKLYDRGVILLSETELGIHQANSKDKRF